LTYAAPAQWAGNEEQVDSWLVYSYLMRNDLLHALHSDWLTPLVVCHLFRFLFEAAPDHSTKILPQGNMCEYPQES
jgi:hypothetical protein